MDQFRQIGMVLGSLEALMVFRDDIQINQHQCSLLFDIFKLAFQVIGEQIKHNLKFEERGAKWKPLEQPLKELHRIFKEGEVYIQQCLDTKDWLSKALLLANNKDCVELHIHNLLCCIPVVVEAIETAGDVSGTDQDEMQKKQLISTRKYSTEWADPKLFQWKFGNQYLVSQDTCNRLHKVWREDRWELLQTAREKRSSGSLTKQEQRLTEQLANILNEWERSSGNNLLPSSVLVGSKDYQVRRRLGSGSHYKEIQWMGESWAVRHFFGQIEPLIPAISTISSFSHPNVMHFLCGFCDEEKKECFLLMELMSKDLSSYIKESCGPRKRIPFSLPVAVDLMLQIARGMEYLHSQQICHGDLNPSNILVRARNIPEGYLLRKFQEQPRNTSSFKYTEKADIYSFGMICFELLTGKVPFEDGHLQGDKMSRNIQAGERPLFPFSAPKYLVNLTKKCWHVDPTQRPSFSSICRVLRYVKRFLVMNPDHSQPDAAGPSIDYNEVEAGLSKKFTTWEIQDLMPVSQIPFQMFVYRVAEKDKPNVNLKDKSSESGSDGASACGEDNAALIEDQLLPIIENKPLTSSEPVSVNKKISITKRTTAYGKPNKQSGTPKGRLVRPPQLSTSQQSLRTNSEGHIHFVTSPNRRILSGHASDSELH
ncbi:hypothetical protein Sjap_021074 [Stephania japonica]|uniref:Protein kinase domain-containing protein n=1 Tax=Stephania japonica TaxID=461633 RepID=A0AAP0F4L5_9MAGN